MAQEEMELVHNWWSEHRSPQQADRWYLGFVEAIISLERNSERCPVAPESDRFSYELRQLNYGLGSQPTHRALLVIRDSTVLILRIRHVAQALHARRGKSQFRDVAILRNNAENLDAIVYLPVKDHESPNSI